MDLSIVLAPLLLLEIGTEAVPHPAVPCWAGQRSWTADGEKPSATIVWGTEDEEQPSRITHNRDQIREGSELVQDYNFIDYWFGSGAERVHARYYLDDERVTVDLPLKQGELLNLAQAEARVPAKTLCFLQRRFGQIDVLTDNGYETIWKLPK